MANKMRDFALKMKFRPNPTTMLHQRLALRGVEHRDIFAYKIGDYCYFVIEQRGGGRDPLLSYTIYRAVTGAYVPPVPMRSLVLKYRSLEPIRAREGANGRWLQRYHHMHIRDLVQKPPAKPFFHLSVRFHYFYAYDLDPMKGFHNMYGNGRGKGSTSKGLNLRRPVTLDDVI